MHHVSRLHQTRARAHNNFQQSICILHGCLMNSLFLSTFPLEKNPNPTTPDQKTELLKKQRQQIYPVIWQILGLFSSPMNREIDHPWLLSSPKDSQPSKFGGDIFWWPFFGTKELSRPHVWSPNRSHPPKHCNSPRPPQGQDVGARGRDP